MKFKLEFAEKSLEIDIDIQSSTFEIGNIVSKYDFTKENGRYMLRKGTKLYRIDNVKIEDSNVEFSINGSWYKVSVKNEQQILLDKLGFKSHKNNSEGNMISPMPGKIMDILINESEEVIKRQLKLLVDNSVLRCIF